MKRIHKQFLIVKEEFQSIELPKDAKILHVGSQYGSPVIWFEFQSTETRTSTRNFQVVATGQEFEEGGDYCGTVQINGFVWHIFERMY